MSTPLWAHGPRLCARCGLPLSLQTSLARCPHLFPCPHPPYTGEVWNIRGGEV